MADEPNHELSEHIANLQGEGFASFILAVATLDLLLSAIGEKGNAFTQVENAANSMLAQMRHVGESNPDLTFRAEEVCRARVDEALARLKARHLSAR